MRSCLFASEAPQAWFLFNNDSISMYQTILKGKDQPRMTQTCNEKPVKTVPENGWIYFIRIFLTQ